MRTSLTHPLYVTWVDLNSEGGRIGMTLCPGKYQPHSMTGGWNRDLSLDIGTLVDLRVNRLISLVTDEDMHVLQVPQLPEMVARAGLAWIHIPLTDSATPTDAWLNSCLEVIHELTVSIPNGELVVVHCMGGMSRAGMFVALMLWWQGLPMAEAIQRVRQTRGNRCINNRQEHYLLHM